MNKENIFENAKELMFYFKFIRRILIIIRSILHNIFAKFIQF